MFASGVRRCSVASCIFLASAIMFACLAWSPAAHAQFGFNQPPGGSQKPAKPANQPETHAATGVDENQKLQTQEATLPTDPLTVPENVLPRIGTDTDPDGETGRFGRVSRTIIPPYYSEQDGRYRFRTIFPLWLERTQPGDKASMYTPLYFHRRSKLYDADVLFPIAWNLRDHTTRTTIIGPVLHSETEAAPASADGTEPAAVAGHRNWVAPLFFESRKQDGSGYLHIPPLLSFSEYHANGGYRIHGPLYCFHQGSSDCDTRSSTKVDLGLFPLYFYGRTQETEYELIPPLLHYYHYADVGDATLNVWGPVWSSHDRESEAFHLMPIYWSSRHEKTKRLTVAPLFHWYNSPEEKFLLTPLFATDETSTGDYTFATWLYARHRGRTQLDMVTPLFWQYRDPDIRLTRTLIPPVFYRNTSPRSNDIAIFPLFARFHREHLRDSWWITPIFHYETSVSGWEFDTLPLFFVGREARSTHLVVAPVLWDFASPQSRATVVPPIYFRFANVDDGVTQVVLNTYYRERPHPTGSDWEFHFFPLFSFGKEPAGYFWSVLYGLAGYERDGLRRTAKTFWVPIELGEGTSGK